MTDKLRLEVRVESISDSDYEANYHHYLQSLIYGLLRNTPFEGIHDDRGYKPFCFSAVIPFTQHLSSGERRTFLVSSPSEEFIEAIEHPLSAMIDTASPIKIGRMEFRVLSLNRLKVEIGG